MTSHDLTWHHMIPHDITWSHMKSKATHPRNPSRHHFRLDHPDHDFLVILSPLWGQMGPERYQKKEACRHCTRIPLIYIVLFTAQKYCYAPYSGKLSREKTFANFTILWKFGGILWCNKSERFAKVFSAKIVFFHQFTKVFSLKSFPLYDI